MFNLATRVQSATNQVLTSASVLAGAVILLTLLQLYFADVWNISTTSISNIDAKSSIKYSFQYGSVNRKPKENAKITFDLETDLSDLFNWNTKQVFVYLTAEYPGKSLGSLNKVTFWDRIIEDKKDAKLSLKGQRGKYSVWDVEKGFRGRNATVKLEWNIQPHIGPLIFGETSKTGFFEFPSGTNQ
ncbi:SPC3 [Candida oxycetoniae]|uniref:Signal peptidase subunit 3 n=1 Tax=Candida oxycetoniae TaxID=497107 RepID=A0AAI9T1W8_9ASCO|nr:SPC3 [Candida oxycetoniae]KAI3407159.1 SPC3 [Candida oxycetoniae]